ncbi:hypothetical protein, conserved [Trypanosoma brucei brucei TREU927]|uniref:Mitochondrial import inner membrane translocase subunit TIM50 n=1 Tax=Trypanosoma brucei brucei (strain 927/4 GUTat10.1) TaxID=185431 RepID=Q57ZN0_TRYB2|nr:hypothetical protein, conserved [Trypanosoma brucei brucei TREU927]AAX79453.1 hypothetical protein, conserved [Trypanosoma brucei]AAZ10316.1 hypothetical protein, conserved [Trypanosoma brucei brucei TREU927]
MLNVRGLLSIITPLIIFFIQIIVDGVESWRHIGKSLYVVFCFFTGRSHLSYPPGLTALRRRKAMFVRHRRSGNSEGMRASSSGLSASEAYNISFDVTDESEAASGRDDGEKRSDGSVSENCSESNIGSDCWVPRLVRGHFRGDVTLLLQNPRTRKLVSPCYHLCYSESLYHLVCNVVGPIQPPTISGLPGRHTAPQWPPHASSRSAFRHGLRDDDITLTTDEYSSSASPQQGTLGARARNIRVLSGGVAPTGITVSSRIIPGVTSVVYRRESSKRVDFNRKVEPRTQPQPIASITAHHVLSYQATRQKVLIVDLDETLCFVSTNVNASCQPPSFSEVIPTASGAELFHVWERPYVRLFIQTVAKLFNLVLFTSSTKPYADSILRRLDPDHRIGRRYYRQHCRQVRRFAVNQLVTQTDASEIFTPRESNPGNSSDCRTPSSSSATITDARPAAPLRSSFYASTPERGGQAVGASSGKPCCLGDMILVKDIRILKVPPELMIMIDNSEECVSANRDNALLIPPFAPPTSPDAANGDTRDGVLLALMPLLEALLVVPDVRSVLRHGRLGS